MDNNLSARCYQNKSKEKFKKPHERYQNLTQEEKEKNINEVVINIKTFLNIKNKGLLIIEKKVFKVSNNRYSNHF